MFDLKIHKEIIIILCECILQSRINVDKQQIQFFNEFIMQFQKHKERVFKGSLELLLTKLIKQQKTEARQKIIKNPHLDKAVISFMLESKQSHVCVEQWILHINPKLQLAQHSEQTFLAVANMFEELLFFISSQPLFTQYIKDSKIKQLCQIHYNFNICSNNQLQKEKQQIFSLLDIPKTYYKQRCFQQFTLKIQCKTIKSIYDLEFIKQKRLKFLEKSKKFSLKSFLHPRQHSTQQKVTNKQSEDQGAIQLQSIKQRKHSLYQIYDSDLQFTLLSSSENLGILSPKASIKQLKFFPKELGIQEEFQVLEPSLDEQFLHQNGKLFKEMSEIEKYKTI